MKDTSEGTPSNGVLQRPRPAAHARVKRALPAALATLLAAAAPALAYIPPVTMLLPADEQLGGIGSGNCESLHTPFRTHV